MRKVRRDDQVFVTTGKERGKRGQVRQVITKNDRVIVAGLNLMKRHQRQRDERTPAGIIEKEGSIHISNLKVICTACQKPTKVGFRTRSDGVKVRYCHLCKEDID